MVGLSAFCSSDLGQGFVQYVCRESLGAEEGRLCKTWHMSGLICLLGLQETVDTGSVVFTGGVKLGRGVLPSKGADNDRMSIAWKVQLMSWILLMQTQLLPGRNLWGYINPQRPRGYHLVNYHCIPGHCKDPLVLLVGYIC